MSLSQALLSSNNEIKLEMSRTCTIAKRNNRMFIYYRHMSQLEGNKIVDMHVKKYHLLMSSRNEI